MFPSDSLIFQTAFWSAATIVLYYVSKRIYGRWPKPYLSPLLLAPLFLILIALAMNTGYAEYIHATHWLMLLLGPVTVAFAIPIYEQRAMIRRYWPVLAFGVTVGSTTAMVTAWALASLLSIDGALRLSLLPRSISTPFAMTISQDIGGVPDLTAVFVVLTGVLGAALGETLLRYLPLKSSLARGALFGMGAHGAGVARAHQIGQEEGSIAGLVMVIVGLVNVLVAPVLAMLLR
ncbi:LrgB family protein [Rhizobium sp. RM]|uniref:LrgB family protein n=1 Tax=Rhizobium/Agrobacterium group TaxID=227290 RepID=UPI00110F3108|nr:MULTISPECIES: LrgB family protein [Rhizobium/Agrobacterium group]NWJ22886.1 LrgB family protein [Rhizobium sp. RM]TMV12217.1 LrgB family protein [Rhizobium sp. Td3]UXS00879.1 LrgB family protein [Agrobacterium tumefaciens]